MEKVDGEIRFKKGFVTQLDAETENDAHHLLVEVKEIDTMIKTSGEEIVK